MRSLLRGANKENAKLMQKISQLNADIALGSETRTYMEDSFKVIEQRNENSSIIQQQLLHDQNSSFYLLKDAIGELKTVVTSINESFVSHESFSTSLAILTKEIEVLKENQKKLAERPIVVPEKKIQKSKKSPKNLSKFSNYELLKMAKQDIEKKQYKSAKRYLTFLIKKKGKLYPKAMFWLGEVYYQNGNYDEAITAFKTSVKESDQGAHMPTLLFHAGISFAKLKRDQEATQFYEMLISLYPNSFLVESAKKRLAKLGS
jgi:TolA-binding protein